MNTNDLPDIPVGAKRIYFAHIIGDIIRVKYKKVVKDKFSFCDVYKDGEEQIEDSYFMRMIRNKIELEKDSESFKITSIEKIKYIGFSLPEIK